MPDFQTARQHASAEETTVEVVLDRALLSRYHDAVQRLQEAQAASAGKLDRGDVAELEEQVAELQRQYDDAQVSIRFVALGQGRWRELLAKHPPSKAEVDEARKNRERPPDHNAETFPPAAMAESSPDLTEEDARWLLLESPLPQGEVNRVWSACLQVNVSGVVDPKATSATAHRLLTATKSS